MKRREKPEKPVYVKPHRREFCNESGKPMYPKEKQALTAASFVEGDMFVYKCPYCKQWHLTKKKQG